MEFILIFIGIVVFVVIGFSIAGTVLYRTFYGSRKHGFATHKRREVLHHSGSIHHTDGDLFDTGDAPEFAASNDDNWSTSSSSNESTDWSSSSYDASDWSSSSDSSYSSSDSGWSSSDSGSSSSSSD